MTFGYNSAGFGVDLLTSSHERRCTGWFFMFLMPVSSSYLVEQGFDPLKAHVFLSIEALLGFEKDFVDLGCGLQPEGRGNRRAFSE